MQYKGKEISQELMTKVMQCKSVDEILKLAAENGIEVSKEEAEAFLDEYSDVELDEEMLDLASGGSVYDCPTDNPGCFDRECKVVKTADIKDKNRIDE